MTKNKHMDINKKDLIQIGLNLLAFIVLFTSTGGNGSFWGFLTFNILSGIILTEIFLNKDKTGLWLWITKTSTYIFLCLKYAQNMGDIKKEYIVMILISVMSLLISKHLIKKRSIALWGQNLAYLIGGYLYILAIINNPDKFSSVHLVFWSINSLSFILLVQEILKENKDKVNLIIPGYALVACITYMAIIIIMK